MPRLFTGLEIPQDLAEALTRLRGGIAGARWTEAHDYHVTLRFVGDIDDRTADEFAHALDGVESPAFSIVVGGLGVFGGDRPREIYAAVEPSRDLAELQAEHERAARRAGLAPERRKFTPHVTLARLRDADPRAVAEWISVRGGMPSRTIAVPSFALFSAKPTFGGGPYRVEATWPLG